MPSRARARIWWERNTWLIPLTGVGLGLVLAQIVLFVDEIEFLVDGSAGTVISASGAIAIMAAIGGGMVTFAGFVFSFVLLIVQFGSTAYSPRLVSLFLQSRSIQVILAIFLTTITFTLVSLLDVGALDEAFVPSLAVSCSVGLLIVSLIGFIVLMHAVGTRIRVDRVIARFGRSASQLLLHDLPDASAPEAPADPQGPSVVVDHRGRSGQITYIDMPVLERMAARNICTIHLIARVGDPVCPGTPVARVVGADGSSIDVSRALVVSAERSLRHDPWYALRILVDIAIRALSPAVNDPTTAVRALDEIENILRTAATRMLGATVHTRGAGTVVRSRIQWPELVDLALLEILTSSRDQPQVNRRLLALVNDLAEDVPAARADVLRAYLPDIDAPGPAVLPARARQVWTGADRQGLGGSS